MTSDFPKENNEKSKRKYLREEGDSQQCLKSPCLEKTSSTLASNLKMNPTSSKHRKLQLFNKAKIQPLTESEAKEPENVLESSRVKNDRTQSTDYLSTLSKNKTSSPKNDEAQQQKIKEYFNMVSFHTLY